jgi:D-alanyl-D-alanine carboxypeptidase
MKNQHFSDEQAKAILARAIEIDARAPTTSPEELRALATEIGISPASLDAAIREHSTAVATRRDRAGQITATKLAAMGVPLGIATGALLVSASGPTAVGTVGLGLVSLLASAGLIALQGSSRTLRSFHAKNLALWSGIAAGSLAVVVLAEGDVARLSAVMAISWSIRSWIASSVLGSAAVIAVRRARNPEGSDPGATPPENSANVGGRLARMAKRVIAWITRPPQGAPMRIAFSRGRAVTLGLLLAVSACARSSRSTAEPAPATDRVQSALQVVLDSARTAARWPGATLAITMPDGRVTAVATGFSDTTRKVPLRTSDRLLQGSVGKTYVAAVAMQLVGEGKLDLAAPISRYLGHEPWFDRLPNARQITVRQLMTHTSGLVRYEFQPAAAAALRANPFKVWTPVDRLTLVFDTQAPFAAGQGWEYSDTNYIVLGMIIERLTGRAYDDELRHRLLVPLRLTNTVAADRPEVPGLANGYAGPKNDLGGYDASVVNGRLAINPQFEWTGGGVASTTADLARWGKLLYEGKAYPPTLLAQALDGVPARLGGNAKYGLGVIIRETPMGISYGHSGFFPGYATEMLYLPSSRMAAAVQVNVTDPYPRGLVPLLLRALRVTADSTA